MPILGWEMHPPCPPSKSQIMFIINLMPYQEDFGGSRKRLRENFQLEKHGISCVLQSDVEVSVSKKTKDVNNALLVKLAWMIASKRDSLRLSLLRAECKVMQDQLYSSPAKVTSPIWKVIKGVRSERCLLPPKRWNFLISSKTLGSLCYKDLDLRPKMMQTPQV